MRRFALNRRTAETDIQLTLGLDGGETAVDTGCGFLDHMLTLFAGHGRFGLTVSCVGDVHVDYHHTTEDIGICLGTALSAALGDRAGLIRYGDITLPMDEALILCAVDLSGRAHLSYEVRPPAEKVGDFDTELVKEFLLGFVRSAGLTLHLRQLSGDNAHHILEGVFKALGRALNRATRIDPVLGGEVPSTKGVL
ncbi:MAG: imidazoleglycerol-phosphate dehydratase HisB [Oscillospiraceae bacterium]|jgi:imidazoleglycerol-phosphate dehydratase|nr:imidazoleglycerol-phosphate dehydratase HisB [Oscillospiraceae bacterium]